MSRLYGSLQAESYPLYICSTASKRAFITALIPLGFQDLFSSVQLFSEILSGRDGVLLRRSIEFHERMLAQFSETLRSLSSLNQKLSS